MGVFAATVHLEHTLLMLYHVARLTEAALFADRGGFGDGTLTVAVQIGTGRWARGEAVRVAAVGGTLQSCGVEWDWSYWLGPKEVREMTYRASGSPHCY